MGYKSRLPLSSLFLKSSCTSESVLVRNRCHLKYDNTYYASALVNNLLIYAVFDLDMRPFSAFTIFTYGLLFFNQALGAGMRPTSGEVL